MASHGKVYRQVFFLYGFFLKQTSETYSQYVWTRFEQPTNQCQVHPGAAANVHYRR